MYLPPPTTSTPQLTSHAQNKALSDELDPVLVLQGVGWILRKAIGLATVTLHIKQYTDDAGITHVDIDQTATGGIKGTSESRQCDWIPREHEDYLFGKVQGKTRWITASEIGDDYQKEGFLEGEEENGGPEGQRHVQGYVVNEKNKWDADQVWGFEVIDGTRYHTRRIVVKKTDGDKVLKIRLVYNWAGKP